MKINARVIFLILIVLTLITAGLACTTGGGGGGGGIDPADATATLGAAQFHAQLTAQAGGQP